MKHLIEKLRSGRARLALVAVSVVALLVAAAPSVAAAEEPAGTSGSAIAKSFVEPLTTKFVEALPIIVGFLVLVAATVAIIKFVQSRGRSKTV